MTTDNHDAELREWAQGLLPLAAATELLIRGRYAEGWRPWVHYDEDSRRWWIDFASIPDLIGAMSGGEQRFLRIAASIGADAPVILGDEIPGLDHEHLVLVLAALAHAAGGHEARTSIATDDSTDPPTARRVQLPPAFAWPVPRGVAS